ncbi:MAG: MATE family efflux transporter [Bacteroidales bacterium]
MNRTTNDLEIESVGKLLLRYSIPAIIAMLVNSLYNIVDRVFIGQGVGAMAISGLALTFPISTLQTACGMLIGAGAGARISIVLGKKDKDWAERILANALMLSFLISGIFILTATIFLDEILLAFGGSEETIKYAESYLRILIPGSIFSTLTFSFCNMLRASGYPSRSMFIIVSGAILNTILDPIFIFVLDLGIEGAAYATILSMAITSVVAVGSFLRKESNIQFRFRNFKLKLTIIRNILAIGISPFLINATSAGIVAMVSFLLIRHGGDLAVGAYGIVNSFIVLMILMVIGICQGMQPIVGYNFGAGHRDRMKDTLKLSVYAGVAVMSIGFTIAMVAPRYVALAFTKDPELIDLAVVGLRYVSLVAPLIGFQIVVTNFFQSIGKVKISIFLSLSRQVLFLFPLLFIIPRFFGLNGVWLAMPISDTISMIVTTLVLYRSRYLFRTSHLGGKDGID